MYRQTVSDGVARAMLLALGISAWVLVEPIDLPAQLMRAGGVVMVALGAASLAAWAVLAVRHGIGSIDN